MDFLDLVKEARTCRRFVAANPLTPEDADWLVNCARFSPSGANAQPLRFITVTQPQNCSQLFNLLGFAAALKDWPGPEPDERPTAYVAVLMPAESDAIMCYDVGIACQSMQLGAASRKWGACMFNTVNRPKAMELLKVPAAMKIALVMGFGQELEIRKLADQPANGSLAYWRDGQKNHYVPKLPLNELIIGRY